MRDNNKISMIVVAAGRGTRAGGALPKQYQMLAGKPLLRHTLDALLACPELSEVIVVIHPDDTDLYASAVSGLSLPDAVLGGDSRQQSSLNGLKAVSANCGRVMIHDAARPFVSRSLISRLSQQEASAVIPGLAVTDTLKQVDKQGVITGTVDRSQLFSVQTPQMFDYDRLMQAYAGQDVTAFTDDAMAMEASGETVTVVDGDSDNFKLTTANDFMAAERIIMAKASDVRSAAGYDVHRFEAGDHVTLCGVDVPHTMKLKGHSDADVAMHALTDALFASIADGDIGSHFPPSDPQWKGAASKLFLEKACAHIRDKGGIISHMAVTIICEAPKIGPHRDSMRAKLAAITHVDLSRISVQATTTEKLGFTGREEGIAAEAICTVRLPL